MRRTLRNKAAAGVLLALAAWPAAAPLLSGDRRSALVAALTGMGLGAALVAIGFAMAVGGRRRAILVRN
ncbi:MAG: hypothetical protein U1E34_10810 [Amaricoccus sp.]